MLRVPELRKAKLADLDAHAWTMRVSVPKGLGRWAAHNSRIEILQELRPHVSDFLDSRREMIEHVGLSECEPLVPTMSGTYYTGTGWSQMRCRVFRRAGIETDRGDGFRILRPSGASFAKDEFDLDLETSQALLRHTNPGTTAKFYARMRAAKAWDTYSRALEARRKVSEGVPAT